jgi:ADP-heptose:LPS heptosyltransferase
MVADCGGQIILMVQSPVRRLMDSLAVVRAGQAQTALLGSKPPDFDLECPLLSLPAVFRTTIETVPWPGAYLFASTELVVKKQPRFPRLRLRDALYKQPRIGVCWAGNPRYKADRQRSVNLATLLPLLLTPGITWISLQKGEAVDQIDALPGGVALLDGSSHDRDLAATDALIVTLDLVITTDTSIAHLAGAMAKPVWILLPHLSDWRWMQQTESTP